MSDKYAAITAHTDRYPVQLMCAALDVSTSGYYAAVARAAAPPSPRALARARRRVLVCTTFERCRRRYGAPRLVRELRAAGQTISTKTVARLLREEGLAARRPHAWVCTTDSTHGEPIADNLLARQFAPAMCPTLNTVWVGDITYIPTRAGWLYLAVLLDLASRCVVGWAAAPTLVTALPLTALQRALAWRQPRPGLIQHTDRGSQYASGAYRAVLTAHGLVPSMSRRGDCWDNAVAESFFATLEHELLATADFHSHREAERAIAAFIDGWYNPERRHSTLGYVSPMQYERQLRRTARAA
jgi:putative transposase